MNQEFTKDELRELEKQLSHPNGEIGIEVGKTMNETNIGMTLNSIGFLELKKHNSVLELGHGNCGHLGKLLESAQGIKYFGLEISETMLSEAKKLNADKEAEFKLYDGETIPYEDSTFDRIFSVNCIYFWSNPEKLMREIRRTLKSNGFCVLAYVNKDFAKNLPFVRDKFTLYDQADITNLAKKSDLEIVEIKELIEQVKSKTAQSVTRKYAMAKLKGL
ncbi:MAG: class I SAM-dependent methyltransferase [Bacteroidota bacterium]